ncbi:S8 family serine peptidase [Candidatus Uabimicrobium sp. HlEnr_7]|uniref:S8 family serine peptidase n=1 Tax=Candidatus Uabimicrobium helgolandensis TaxID=3095367 RepID=UPI003556C528
MSRFIILTIFFSTTALCFAQQRIGQLLQEKLVAEDIQQYALVELHQHIDINSQAHRKSIKNMCTMLEQQGNISSYYFFDMVNILAVKANKVAIEELASHPDIQSITWDKKYKWINLPDVEHSATSNWGLSYMKVKEAQHLSIGKDVTIALLSTGVDLDHPQIKEQIILQRAKSFIPDTTPFDDHGHGTYCAGITVGKNFGVAPGANLLPVKVVDHNGNARLSQVIRGIEYACKQKVDVLHLPIGANLIHHSIMERVFSKVEKLEIACVVAAGDNGPQLSTIQNPGSISSVITVGAIDDRQQLAQFSSRGPTERGGEKPEIVAPGVGIPSIWPTEFLQQNKVIHGTSVASSFVAGIIALALNKQKVSTVKLKELFVTNTFHNQQRNSFGYGVIDALSTLQSLKKNKPISTISDNEVINQIPIKDKDFKPKANNFKQQIYHYIQTLLGEAGLFTRVIIKNFVLENRIDRDIAFFDMRFVQMRFPRSIKDIKGFSVSRNKETKELYLHSRFEDSHMAPYYSTITPQTLTFLINNRRKESTSLRKGLGLPRLEKLNKSDMLTLVAKQMAENIEEINEINYFNIGRRAQESGYKGRVAVNVSFFKEAQTETEKDNQAKAIGFGWMKDIETRKNLLGNYNEIGIAIIDSSLKNGKCVVIILGKQE